jgi:YegS/Rv2252/BmrU family lipid kinase
MKVASKALSHAGWQLQVVRTELPGQAEAAAAEAVRQRQQAVVVVGGDGTINEVVNALAGHQVPLGIIPAGTGNVLARQMRLPYDPLKACRILLSSHPDKADLGRVLFPGGNQTCTSRYFLSMAGIGFDAQIVQAVTDAAKARLGPWAYVLSLLREARRPKVSHLTIRVDGEEIQADAWLLVVANGASYAWRLSICPQAKMDDGLLDMSLFLRSGSAPYIQQLLGTLLTARPFKPGMPCRRFQHLEVDADPPLLVQLDGDLRATTPVTVDVAPQALRILMPALRSSNRPL